MPGRQCPDLDGGQSPPLCWPSLGPSGRAAYFDPAEADLGGHCWGLLRGPGQENGPDLFLTFSGLVAFSDHDFSFPKLMLEDSGHLEPWYPDIIV